jgi:mannose-6-phosphate isomerase-like protein (cupin superfamily)
MANYMMADFNEVDVVDCPCGYAQRAFINPENEAASLHIVEITEDAQVHYHKEHTEIYLVLDGEGFVELDGELEPVKPLTAVLIKPGCRHRASGRMRIVNVCIPPFDTEDEWFD